MGTTENPRSWPHPPRYQDALHAHSCMLTGAACGGGGASVEGLGDPPTTVAPHSSFYTSHHIPHTRPAAGKGSGSTLFSVPRMFTDLSEGL